MLARTSHLPLASHRLSVLVTQHVVISSDVGGAKKQKKGGETIEETRFWPCVFWVMTDIKPLLFNLLSFLAAPPPLPYPDSLCDLILYPFFPS